jgi:hypothetical protein
MSLTRRLKFGGDSLIFGKIYGLLAIVPILFNSAIEIIQFQDADALSPRKKKSGTNYTGGYAT